jgi:hypothetical protein
MSAELGDIRGAVQVEHAVTQNLTLVAKLLGQLVQVHDVRHTSLLVTPDYLRLRAALVSALRPFPEAARAVGAALHRMECEAAEEIKTHARAPKPVTLDARVDTVPAILAVPPPPLPPLPPIPPPPPC